MLWFALSRLAFADPEMIPEEAMEILGHPAPDFVVPLKDGGTFKLSAQLGRPVVISFWASWCGPCRAELPALSAYAASHPEVVWLALNVDREKAPSDAFLQKVNVTIPIGYDNDAVTMGTFGVSSMPTLFLVDKKGNIALQHVGYSAEKGFADLDAALSGKPPPATPAAPAPAAAPMGKK